MNGEENRPSADTTLSVILGVSKCPRSPHLADLPGSRNAADAFYGYLTTNFELAEENIKDLFDSRKSPADQLGEIGDWLFIKGKFLKDLIVFYTGHGGFTPGDHKFFLATRSTKERLEGATSIRIVDLATALEMNAPFARRYLIFDCCFAGSVVSEFMSSPGAVALSKTKEAFPTVGTAILCSSSSQDISIAPTGGRFTRFSEALLGVLVEGNERISTDLSLYHVGAQARERIVERYPEDRMRPEVHSPNQREGNVAMVELFPNAALRSRRREEKKRLEAERREKDRIEAARLEKERLEAEQREKDHVEAERLERLKKERLEAERQERERLDREEKERLDAEQRQREERERQDLERLEALRLENERLASEYREQERLEAARLEAERRKRLDDRRQAREEREPLEEERMEPPAGQAGLEQVNASEPAKGPERVLKLQQGWLRLAPKFSFVPFALVLPTYFLAYQAFHGSRDDVSGMGVLTYCLQNVGPSGPLRWTVNFTFLLASVCNILVLVSCFLKYRRKAILEASVSSIAAILYIAVWSMQSNWHSIYPGIGLILACVLLAAGALVKIVLLKKERLEAELGQIDVSEPANDPERVPTLQHRWLRLAAQFSFVPFALVLPTYFLEYWDGGSGSTNMLDCLKDLVHAVSVIFILANLCYIFMLVSCFLKYRGKAILEVIISSAATIMFLNEWSFLSSHHRDAAIGLMLACIFLAAGAIVKIVLLVNGRKPVQL